MPESRAACNDMRPRLSDVAHSTHRNLQGDFRSTCSVRSLPLEGGGLGWGSAVFAFDPHPTASASLRRIADALHRRLRTAAEGRLCSPLQGEVGARGTRILSVAEARLLHLSHKLRADGGAVLP